MKNKILILGIMALMSINVSAGWSKSGNKAINDLKYFTKNTNAQNYYYADYDDYDDDYDDYDDGYISEDGCDDDSCDYYENDYDDDYVPEDGCDDDNCDYYENDYDGYEY